MYRVGTAAKTWNEDLPEAPPNEGFKNIEICHFVIEEFTVWARLPKPGKGSSRKAPPPRGFQQLSNLLFCHRGTYRVGTAVRTWKKKLPEGPPPPKAPTDQATRNRATLPDMTF